MSYYLAWVSTTIASSGTTTAAIDLSNNADFMDVLLPSAWTSGTIRLQVSEANVTWNDLGGTALTTNTAVASQALVLRVGGYRYVKIICSAAQGAERALRVRGWRS